MLHRKNDDDIRMVGRKNKFLLLVLQLNWITFTVIDRQMSKTENLSTKICFCFYI